MIFTRTGLILNTQNYDACKIFYGDVLGLPLMDQFGQGADEITVFALSDSYLMLEHDGVAHPRKKSADICPTKLRFNVADVNAAALSLRDNGIEVVIRHHVWGTKAEFSDPDGNRCALRSEGDFGPTQRHSG